MLVFFSACTKKSMYNEPTITIHEATWIILAGLNDKIPHELSYTASQEDKKNWRKWSVVSWYVYTYRYQDLWIQVTTSPLYEPYFSTYTKETILRRNTHMIYFSNNARFWWDYIDMFFKDPKISLQKTIEKNHLGTWCVAQNILYTWYDLTKDSWFQSHERSGVDTNNFFTIGWLWWWLWSDTSCHPDTVYPENYWSIFFVQSRYHTDRYYKVSLSDACAPGPCSIFGKIEFF